MYHIIINEEIKGFLETPRYIKINPETRAYIEAKLDEAVGVAFGGIAYNLIGHDEIPDAPQAIVKEIDGAEIVFNDSTKIIKHGENIFEIESVLCEFDMALNERMNEINEMGLALCELDEAINGGGTK